MALAAVPLEAAPGVVAQVAREVPVGEHRGPTVDLVVGARRGGG